MDKMETLDRKKPAVERTRSSREETWTRARPQFLAQFVQEAWQGLENGIEVVPWKVVQEDLIFR